MNMVVIPGEKKTLACEVDYIYAMKLKRFSKATWTTVYTFQ